MLQSILAWLGGLPSVVLYLALALFAAVENIFPPLPTDTVVAFGTWLFVAVPFFGPFLIGFVASVLAPDDLNARHFIGQFLPSTLYGDVSNVILNPTVQTTSRTITSSQYLQAQNFFPDSALSVAQSLVLVWPPLVTLFALTIGCFALAYVRFMRQEVRA